MAIQTGVLAAEVGTYPAAGDTANYPNDESRKEVLVQTEEDFGISDLCDPVAGGPSEGRTVN